MPYLFYILSGFYSCCIEIQIHSSTEKKDQINYTFSFKTNLLVEGKIFQYQFLIYGDLDYLGQSIQEWTK